MRVMNVFRAVYGNIDNQFDDPSPNDPLGCYVDMQSEVEEYFKGSTVVKVLSSQFNLFKGDRFTSYLQT